MSKEKRKYETNTQIIYRISGRPLITPEQESEKIVSLLKDGYGESFTGSNVKLSREVILRLIEWIKEM